MIDKVMVFLQSHMDLLTAEASFCRETYLTSSSDENEVIKLKAEYASDAEDGDDPLQITCPARTELEVSSMVLHAWLGIFHKYRIVTC
jgi:hypothetical protein